MTLLPSTKAHPSSLCRFHPYDRCSRVETPTPTAAPEAPPSQHGKTFAKPFDRFTASGGGASGDIFRYFKIHRSEEENFIIHWVRQLLAPGLLTRDENGILVFRVSSSDISYLSALGIGHSDSELDSGVEVEWTHVYDEQGISWLSRCRGIDYTDGKVDIYGISDEMYEKITRENNGVIGMYGPSGLTPSEFYRLRVAEGKGERVGQSKAD